MRVGVLGSARGYADDSRDAHRIQEQFDGKTVDWIEKVSDEQWKD